MSSSNQSEYEVYTATSKYELVMAIKFNLYVKLLNAQQFKLFWNKIPLVLSQQQAISLLTFSKLKKWSKNISNFQQILKIIYQILKDEKSTATITTQYDKLDVLPCPIIQEISSFLSICDFFKLEKVNRTIFVAMNLPSKLNKIDLRYSYRYSKIITLNQFQQILSNNHHIKWLAVPSYLLKEMHTINWKHTLQIEHFECTFDDGRDEYKFVNEPLISKRKIQLRQNIVNNLVNIGLFELQKILSLSINGDDLNTKILIPLLNKCNNLQHLCLQSFEDTSIIESCTSSDVNLPNLKFLQLYQSGSFGLLKSCANKLEKISLYSAYFGEYSISETINLIGQIHFNNLTQIFFHMFYDQQIYTLLKQSPNVASISLTNQQRYVHVRDGNIEQIVSYIIKNINKLKFFRIIYHENTDDWKDVNGYDLIYEGIEQGFQHQIDHIIKIKVEEKISLQKIKDILKQIKSSNSIGIMINFQGSFVFNQNDFDSKPIQTIQEIKSALNQVIAQKDFNGSSSSYNPCKIQYLSSNQDQFMINFNIEFRRRSYNDINK